MGWFLERADCNLLVSLGESHGGVSVFSFPGPFWLLNAALLAASVLILCSI